MKKKTLGTLLGAALLFGSLFGVASAMTIDNTAGPGTSNYGNFKYRAYQTHDYNGNDHIDWTPVSGDKFDWPVQSPTSSVYSTTAHMDVYIYNDNFVNSSSDYYLNNTYIGTLNQYSAPGGWQNMDLWGNSANTPYNQWVLATLKPKASGGAAGADAIWVDWDQVF